MSARAWGQICSRARGLTRSLGVRRAAGYLRNRDVPFEVAYAVLFNRAPRVL